MTPLPAEPQSIRDTPPAVRSDIVGGHPEPMSVALSRFIHFARWVAACAVLLHHVSATFVSVPDIMTAPHGPLAYVWWFFTPMAFAHESVVVFFVLSGFLVGGAVVKRRRDTQPWLRGYVVDRLVRIYVVLLPTLALTWLFDASGRVWFRDTNLYNLSFLDGHFDPHLIVPNLLSLQGLWYEPLGSNLPLWSLGMEVWFYLLFPLLLLPWLAAYPRHWRRVFGLAAAILFLLALPGGNYMPFGFAIWTLGALVRVLPKPVLRSKWLALSLFIVASIIVRLAVREHILRDPPVKYFADAGEALLFANLLLTLRFDVSEGFRFARADANAKLASFSYTLYAFHVPVVFWLAGLLATAYGAGWRLQPATPLHYAVAVGVVGTILGLGYLLSRVTEVHTERVRITIRRLVGGRGRDTARAQRDPI